MQSLPHHYAVTATAAVEGNVQLSGAGLQTLESAAPAEFGGPGNQWSPETLLIGAVADCFVLSFRAIAKASRFDWTSLDCQVTGTLDKNDGVTKFVELQETVTLRVPQGADYKKAKRMLAMAEKACLISNSMSATVHLNAKVVHS